MSFAFEPAHSLLIVAAFVGAASIVGLLLVRRSPLRRALNLALGVALVAILLGRYQEHRMLVDDSGISADTYGEPRIAWEDMTDVIFIGDLAQSQYRPRPTLRTSFRILGYGKAYYGRFDLANGDRALVAAQQVDGPAVLVVTAGGNYLFAPAGATSLAQTIARYRPVAGLANTRP